MILPGHSSDWLSVKYCMSLRIFASHPFLNTKSRVIKVPFNALHWFLDIGWASWLQSQYFFRKYLSNLLFRNTSLHRIFSHHLLSHLSFEAFQWQVFDIVLLSWFTFWHLRLDQSWIYLFSWDELDIARSELKQTVLTYHKLLPLHWTQDCSINLRLFRIFWVGHII